VSLYNPTLASFSSNLDSRTQSKISNATSGDFLIMQATISESEILLLVGLEGHLTVGDFTMKALFLSLSVTLPATSLEFGIVGMMSMKLRTETMNGVTEPVIVVSLVQLFLDISDAGVGLGFETAVCRSPWEILPGITILFPGKFKMVINLESGILTMVAFAGGFELGEDSSNTLETYSQIMVSDETFSVYFSMEEISFSTLVDYFVGGITLPAIIQNMISIGSVTVSFNPSDSGGSSTTQSTAPSVSSLVASSGSDASCNNTFSLLSFAPLPSGIYIDVKYFNILNGFIVIDEATIIVSPDEGIYVAVTLEKITSIPGIVISDFSGDAGPSFILSLTTNDFEVSLSGAFSFFGFRLASEFTISPTGVTADTSIQIVPEVYLNFTFAFSPQNPLNGLSFSAFFSDPNRQLIQGIINGINSLFAQAQSNVANAKAAVSLYVTKLEEAQANLRKAQAAVDAGFASAINAVQQQQGRCDGYVLFTKDLVLTF
jgi:hypothetical protein